MMTEKDTEVFNIGKCEINSTLDIPQFIPEGERVILDIEYKRIADAFQKEGKALSLENAGPRKKIFFDPHKTKAAIVTCGGLCPGLNNVIKSLVNQLHNYGVKTIYGIPYGYEGLVSSYNHEFIELNPNNVRDIHTKGGTILGSSRGKQDPLEMLDTLVKNDISVLFTIGGDGTLRGQLTIFEEIKKRGLKIATVGVPKTIDNDIRFVDKTFGFETAVSFATMTLQGAHAEATGARNGIGLVKVMGRDSGFIAAYASLASNVVDYVLIPEVDFQLDGERGLLNRLHQTLQKNKHAVILVAEGAGQKFFEDKKEFDASGNIKYGDIGLFLKDKITTYFKEINFHTNLKYIDPSYVIRSMPASPDDAVFCIMLAQNAVHGAMAGKTGVLVGRWNSYFTFIPIKLAIEKRKTIDPKGYLWSIVKEATAQPDLF
ncbi:MAG: ATP-dependent 6-phosphofructokinase [Leptospiraceae bacterium]|nr:ATP-dependent 6-phosphofructokinase [Leptospiraceae bacterium]MCP5495706.1 ATP-dependent 6-phosphofructokinase [Leptospiraceae bacterium]